MSPLSYPATSADNSHPHNPISFPEHFIQEFPCKPPPSFSSHSSVLMRAMWCCSILDLERSLTSPGQPPKHCSHKEPRDAGGPAWALAPRLESGFWDLVWTISRSSPQDSTSGFRTQAGPTVSAPPRKWVCNPPNTQTAERALPVGGRELL